MTSRKSSAILSGSLIGGAARVAFHRDYDEVYFTGGDWSSRVRGWLAHERQAGNLNPFLGGNERLIRQTLEHSETGLRMVVNISAFALLNFLQTGLYKNLYEHPVIGGKRMGPTRERRRVDDLLDFGADAKDYYFGAVALGGTGVRFYGEYCMALKPTSVDAGTRIFDRDSYDMLVPPLSDLDEQELRDLSHILRGEWGQDVVDMLVLKLLPELRSANRLLTTGVVSELVLHDQDFVEVHYNRKIETRSIEEIRQSPDEIALESRILSRRASGFPPTSVELLWLRRREEVARAMELRGIRYRIVTLHGKGYQWR